MIKSVVREFHWTFLVIEQMYLDDEDYKGLEFWYNDIVAMSAELKAKK